LSAESSYTEGKWQAYPYQIAILDAFGTDDIVEVSVKKISPDRVHKNANGSFSLFHSVSSS
jgi:phage terminase large subunit GpA-like protein